jgi:putative oxidoreductase
LQRLFSVFPNGWPGLGLLVQRVLIAASLFRVSFGHSGEVTLFVLHIIAAGAGTLLLLGLWTPACATCIAAFEVWIACSYPCVDEVPLLLAAFTVTLAMTGPGARSIDARLFGRKHFEIPHR